MKQAMRIYSLLALILASLSVPGFADTTGIDVTLSASIMTNTCELSLPEGGNIQLPVVPRSWFYNPDGSDRFKPTDDAGGKKFTVQVTDCGGNTLGKDNTLHFTFRPQSRGIASQKQVFVNERENAPEGAKNVGVVIFSEASHQNVLQSDGTSDVIFNNASSQSADNYLTWYTFYARYQNTGEVSSGRVTSNVLVSVTYE